MTSVPEQRRLWAVIRETLLRDGDPIGIQDIPEAKDEYDSYVGPVFMLLEKRSTATEFFQYLWKIETHHMGLTGDREKTERGAATLAALSNQQ